MNYQPFYDMNILVSDDLLAILSVNQIAIAAFIFISLCLPSLLVLTISSLIRHFFFPPVRIYPPHQLRSYDNV